MFWLQEEEPEPRGKMERGLVAHRAGGSALQLLQ